MSLLSQVGALFLDGIGPVDVQARHASDFPSFEDQMAAIQRRSRDTYRTATAEEAMSVPAIFGAVSLIANTVGSLSLEAFRKGVLMAQEDAPRLIQRPNPFSNARVFFRDTALHLGTRGDAWWYTAVRDPVDGSALSLVVAPPWEITVTQNDDNRLRPEIKWGDRIIPNERMTHITYLPDRSGLRGVGPLQLCGAAVSVAVEAQQWAANFFSGSIPSIIGTTELDMTEDELLQLDKQWNEKPPNTPRWLTNAMKLSDSPFDPGKAQLNESRQHQVGDVARMFNLPGALLEYQMGGSSLTYQNQQDIWADFLRRCLSPNYLEPMEQAMSDLLTRSTVARFNVKQLLRASPKERMEVHQLAISNGIYDANTAAREEGYAPGNVDFAPVPFAPPQAVPTLLPPNRELGLARSAMEEIRCPKCGRVNGEAAGAFRTVCKRCGTMIERVA
jgi:HK97 family phage portal protein